MERQVQASQATRKANNCKVQCRIFSTTYNPDRLRLGNKILRQRLKGPTLAAYYPRKVATIKDLKKQFPDFEVWDDDELDRLEKVAKYGFNKHKTDLVSN